MILYPLNSPDRTGEGLIPAWDAIERTQKQAATEWWLIAQPDHAALAGDLASRISSPEFPQLDSHLLQAIALHDEGWAQFDGRAPKLDGQGRPTSFLQTSPPDFVNAWRGSIERAVQVAATGGIVVSEHFCRIARVGLQSFRDAPSGLQVIRDFLKSETERQRQLSRGLRHSAAEISGLIDVLQFCDLLSLYFCCGSQDSVDFPQKFHGCTIRLRREAELCRMEPPLFESGVSLAIRARRYPAAREPQVMNIPILLAQ
jgi:hypothetical protein